MQPNQDNAVNEELERKRRVKELRENMDNLVLNPETEQEVLKEITKLQLIPNNKKNRVHQEIAKRNNLSTDMISNMLYRKSLSEDVINELVHNESISAEQLDEIAKKSIERNDDVGTIVLGLVCNHPNTSADTLFKTSSYLIDECKKKSVPHVTSLAMIKLGELASHKNLSEETMLQMAKFSSPNGLDKHLSRLLHNQNVNLSENVLISLAQQQKSCSLYWIILHPNVTPKVINTIAKDEFYYNRKESIRELLCYHVSTEANSPKRAAALKGLNLLAESPDLPVAEWKKLHVDLLLTKNPNLSYDVVHEEVTKIINKAAIAFDGYPKSTLQIQYSDKKLKIIELVNKTLLNKTMSHAPDNDKKLVKTPGK